MVISFTDFYHQLRSSNKFYLKFSGINENLICSAQYIISNANSRMIGHDDSGARRRDWERARELRIEYQRFP